MHVHRDPMPGHLARVNCSRSRGYSRGPASGCITTAGAFMSQSRGKLLTIFPIRFTPRFPPAPTVKIISQQHHYVKYAYTRAWCQNPSRNLPLRCDTHTPHAKKLTVFPPGRNSGFRHGRAPRRTPSEKRPPQASGGALSVCSAHPQAGLRGTNVHVFRFLGRSPNRGIYAPPTHRITGGRYAIFGLFTSLLVVWK